MVPWSRARIAFMAVRKLCRVGTGANRNRPWYSIWVPLWEPTPRVVACPIAGHRYLIFQPRTTRNTRKQIVERLGFASVYSGVLWFYSTNLGDGLILSESARSMVSDLCCLRGADSKGGGISKCRASLSDFLTTDNTEHTETDR